MKLKKDIILHIQNAVKTAHMLGIEMLCIEDGLIRAMREDRAVLIIHPNEIELPFESIGISRIPYFLSRLQIVSDINNFSINYNESENFIKSLVMKSDGIKIDFKCANPSNIIAPKKLADDILYGINVSADSIELLKKGEVAMKADTITINSNETDGVSFEMNDLNNDIFKHQLSTKATALNGDNINFVFNYPSKLLISLFKQNITYFEIAEKGSLKIKLNGFDTFVLPQV